MILALGGWAGICGFQRRQKMYLRLSIAISVALLIVAISYSIASFIAVYKVKNEIKSSWAFDNLEVRVSWPSWNFVESKNCTDL